MIFNNTKSHALGFALLICPASAPVLICFCFLVLTLTSLYLSNTLSCNDIINNVQRLEVLASFHAITRPCIICNYKKKTIRSVDRRLYSLFLYEAWSGDGLNTGRHI
jgi:hypothetical protein